MSETTANTFPPGHGTGTDTPNGGPGDPEPDVPQSGRSDAAQASAGRQAHAGDHLPPMDRLVWIMAQLRDPQTGCPWDRDQTASSIARYAIEEAYEVVEAIETGDDAALMSELGDLLFQVVFHAQIAQDRGAFNFDSVAGAIADKMVSRHPHVFAGATIAQAEQQERAWEALKAQERAAKAAAEDRRPSALDDVPAAFPAALRAQKLAKRAAAVGFDYPDAASAHDKVLEELTEVMDAAGLLAGDADRGPDPTPAQARPQIDHQHVVEEMGDVLFAAVCLSMKLGVNAEDALRAANAKFERRFRALEQRAHDSGTTLADMTLAQMDTLWDAVKHDERA